MSLNDLKLRGMAAPALPGGANRTILQGAELSSSLPALPVNMEDGTIIHGKWGNISLSDYILSHSTLFMGMSGCGKTTAMMQMTKRFLEQLSDDGIVLVFDSKKDYMKRFFDPNNPKHIVVSSSPADLDISYSWNIFHELLAHEGNYDDYSEILASELSSSLFSCLKDSSQPFFPLTAADIFAKILIAFIRNAVRTGDFTPLNNTALKSALSGNMINNIKDLMSGYPDLSDSISMYLGDSDNNQALGILAFLNITKNRLFIGPFGNKCPSGDFSVRRLVREKKGRVIFLEYDVALAGTFDSIYSTLLDLAVNEAMSIGTGRTYIITDEASLLPYSKAFATAPNFGRSRGIRLVTGIQSINQFVQNYGEAQAKSIFAGFGNLFCFRARDIETRQFIQESFGKTFENYSWSGINTQHEGYTVADSDILSLSPGECYANIFEYRPFKFKFEQNF